MNPMALLKLKPLLESFRSNHPKFGPFISAASSAIDEGTVLEMKITTSEGQTILSNLKVTADDIKLFEELKNLQNK